MADANIGLGQSVIYFKQVSQKSYILENVAILSGIVLKIRKQFASIAAILQNGGYEG